eukprot:CAMPEP_0118632334 /NCGR_PEP_ID=MMETSP0785-20121206/391_1 /TAXON_ID=91992 /ORGANISM="Bolidomonas pacifica, Strain CCMP 1866" /LENGTH=95 /DNA_ID=CAMNT_0006523101 /DNA_START=301 /DNA_END=588 /DNA_ORIENTATION=+
MDLCVCRGALPPCVPFTLLFSSRYHDLVPAGHALYLPRDSSVWGPFPGALVFILERSIKSRDDCFQRGAFDTGFCLALWDVWRRFFEYSFRTDDG